MGESKKQYKRREESIGKILYHGEKLFLSDGYKGTTIRKIAQNAGISLGLTYNYFSSKEEILQVIFEKSMSHVFHSFTQSDKGKSGKEKLRALIESAFTVVAENLDFWKLIYSLRIETENIPVVSEGLLTFTKVIIEKLTAIFTELKSDSPITDAYLLFAQIDGVSQHYSMNPQNYPLEKVKQKLFELYTI